ncbi:ABC transporter substrate-binding protein [Cohnella rhizosphaerae]|uniref:ABC transporter substrate-binding protein n=1 Tax=Cohnella rhizosphaerae TaxID=1457232 RepID=A0A9X4QRP7_9BACL|nr:ABC transporter substrate-binding protein [Cohnella rhizosphaerae]MDG0809276.1 ABC transporter substrate-binding protein [Cohnella rhizosphaerae]
MRFKLAPRFAVSLSLVFALFVLSACEGRSGKGSEGTAQASPAVEAVQDAAADKTVNVGVTYAPSDINPLSPDGPVSAYVAGLLFPPLVEIDADLRYKPMLADAIETADNRTFKVRLNEAANWTDGASVTADDVIFTLKLMANAMVASNCAYLFAILEGLGPSGLLPDGERDISGVRKIDDHTVEMRTKVPTTLAVFEDTVGRNLRTLPRSAFEGVAPEDMGKSAFMRAPNVTSGPFKLERYEPDRFVGLIANKGYFKGAPKLERLNFKVLPASALADALARGEIDMNIPSAGVIPVQDYARIERLPNVSTVGGQPLTTLYMYVNEKAVPDRKQRRAISHAIDRRKLVDKLLGGAGEIVDGYFSSVSPYRSADTEPAAFDLAMARRLLKEAGWNGRKALTLSAPSGDEAIREAAHRVSDSLGKVGIRVNVEIVGQAELSDKLLKQDFDLSLLPLTMTPVNPLPDLAYLLGAGNPNGYKNEKVNELLAAVGAEVDEAKIKALYGELQAILAEDVPMPALYAAKALGAVNGRVIGATPKDFGMFIDVQDWTVRRDEA